MEAEENIVAVHWVHSVGVLVDELLLHRTTTEAAGLRPAFRGDTVKKSRECHC